MLCPTACNTALALIDTRISSHQSVFQPVNDVELMSVYLLNTHICDALYSLIGTVEVSLHNTIDQARWLGALTDPISAAYFDTNKGKFRMTYLFSEQATMLSGEVLLTDEATGHRDPIQGGR